MREFWHELESATNERQAAMFGLLNGHLARLGARVEAAVGGLLHVRLEPAALCLAPPSAQQHHADLQALFDAGERGYGVLSCAVFLRQGLFLARHKGAMFGTIPLCHACRCSFHTLPRGHKEQDALFGVIFM